jgi:hypothetical protein
VTLFSEIIISPFYFLSWPPPGRWPGGIAASVLLEMRSKIIDEKDEHKKGTRLIVS